jgi:hypothetical protein
MNISIIYVEAFIVDFSYPKYWDHHKGVKFILVNAIKVYDHSQVQTIRPLTYLGSGMGVV